MQINAAALKDKVEARIGKDSANQDVLVLALKPSAGTNILKLQIPTPTTNPLQTMLGFTDKQVGSQVVMSTPDLLVYLLKQVFPDLLDSAIRNNPTNNEITIDLDFLAKFEKDLPFNCEPIPDSPLTEVNLTGSLHLKAELGLKFTLGCNLTPVAPPQLVSHFTPSNGVLKADSSFRLKLDSESGTLGDVAITLPQFATSGNGNPSAIISADNLAQDFNMAFQGKFLSDGTTRLEDVVEADRDPKSTLIVIAVKKPSATSTNLALDTILRSINRLQIIADDDDPIASELLFSREPVCWTLKGLFIENATLSGSLDIQPSQDANQNPIYISGKARLSVFGVTTSGGSVMTLNGNVQPGPITAGMSLTNPDASDTAHPGRVTLAQFIKSINDDTLSDIVGSPTISGGVDLQLNNLATIPVLPLSGTPQLRVFIPDFTAKPLKINPEPYDAATNPKGIFLTYPDLGGLFNFQCFGLDDIVLALKSLVDEFKGFNGFEFLNQELPLVNLSISQILDYAAQFGHLVSDLQKDPAGSIGELEKAIEKLFKLPDSLLTISILDPLSKKTTTTPLVYLLSPPGLNNALRFEIAAPGTQYADATVQIIGHKSITDNTAQATYEAKRKVLRILVNPGVTTATAVLDAVNSLPSSSPWQASLETDDDNPATTANDGSGVITTVALKFHLVPSIAITKPVNFGFDMDKIAELLPDDSPFKDFIKDLSNIVQVEGSGQLIVSASASLTLDFGFDLTNPCKFKPFIYDSTHIKFTADVRGTNLNFKLGSGMVGFWVKGGAVTLNEDGLPATQAPARFTLSLIDNDGNGRHYLKENFFNQENLKVELVAGASAVLPIFAPFENKALGGVGDTNNDGYPDNQIVVDIPDIKAIFVPGKTKKATATATDATTLLSFRGDNNDILFNSGSTEGVKVRFKHDKDLQTPYTPTLTWNASQKTVTITVRNLNTTADQVKQLIGTATGFTATFATSDNTTNGTGVVHSPVILIAPDFRSLFDGIDFCDLLKYSGVFLDGLDKLLGKVQDALTNKVLAQKLPLVGDKLAKAANFIQEFRDGLLDKIGEKLDEAGGDPVELIRQAIAQGIFDVLGPGANGLNLLVKTKGADQFNPNPDAVVTPDDVEVTADCETGELLVNLRLRRVLAVVDTSADPIAVDIGVPGLGLKVNGDVSVNLGFDFYLTFGLSKKDGFFLGTSHQDANGDEIPELSINFTAAIPGLTASGELGFLNLLVSDEIDGLDAEGNPRSSSAFVAEFSIDLMDPAGGNNRLTVQDVLSGGFTFDKMVTVDFGVMAGIQLTFGYDTLGLQKFFSTGKKNIADLFEGFYIKDLDDSGNEMPELTLFGSIVAFAALNLGVVSGGVGGGLFFTVDFDLNDPNHDGRVRTGEIVANAKKDLRCIFDIHGEISVGLVAFVKVLTKRFDFEIAMIKLIEFDLTGDDAVEPEPVLASVNNSTGLLTLNMGPNAPARSSGAVDGSESFTVKHKAGDPTSIEGETVTVIWNGKEQEYAGVKGIVAEAGVGDDKVILKGVKAPARVTGGPGNDEIVASDADTANATCVQVSLPGGSLAGYFGDDGDDILTGTGKNDWLNGGADNDTITANAGDDAVFGGAGSDTITGGDGDDTIDGGEGANTIYGDGGNDAITGGDEPAPINPAATVLGDFLYGDFDDAHFNAGPGGNDTIVAGAGNDEVYGGGGNDVLDGDDGDDLMWGEDGDDVMRGGPGNDRMVGGLGGDRTFGEGDDDVLVGDELKNLPASLHDAALLMVGFDTPPNSDRLISAVLTGLSGAGNDIISGGGGHDVIFGVGGDDLIFGGTLFLSGSAEPASADGNDFIDAGLGNDTVVAEDGNAGAGERNAGISVGNNVWDDANGNGQRDDGETGIANITVRLFKDSDHTSPVAATVTDAEGNYEFTSLNPDTYYLEFDGLPDMAFTNLTNVSSGGKGNDTLKGDSLTSSGGTDRLLEERAGNFQLLPGVLQLGGEMDPFSGFEEISLMGDDTNNRLDASLFGGTVYLDGRGGDDIIVGGSGTNYLTGGPGNDIMNGTLGTDILIEERNADFKLTNTGLTTTLLIGTETDTFMGTIERVRLTGGPANNTLDTSMFSGPVELEGGAGSDILIAGGNNDTLTGGGGDDTLQGGAGQDVYYFDADETLGWDTVIEVRTTGGTDTLNFSQTTGDRVIVDLSITAPQTVNGNRTLVLSDGEAMENIVGSDFEDSALGVGDILTGNGLNNRIEGGKGVDRLIVIRDAAKIELTDTAVTIGTEIDALFDIEKATLEGGPGANDLDASQFTKGSVLLLGHNGNDTLRGGFRNDILDGGLGSDLLLGGDGGDTYIFNTDSYTLTGPLAETDTIVEPLLSAFPTVPPTPDTLDFSAITQHSIHVDLASSLLQDAARDAGGTVCLRLSLFRPFGADLIENVIGGALDDELTGNSLNNLLDGARGNDQLSGRSGDDMLLGGVGIDELTGGVGDDKLFGGADDDTYFFAVNGNLGSDEVTEEEGAPGGSDTLNFAGTTSPVTLNLSYGHQQTVVNSGSDFLRLTFSTCAVFEKVSGGSGANTLAGNALDNVLVGGPAGDTLSGGYGNDELIGNGGADTLYGDAGDDILTGGAGTDTLHGGAGKDQLAGDDGADELFGDAGDDKLTGGAGGDKLHGGVGSDIYFFDLDALGVEKDDVFETAGKNGGTDTLDFTQTTTRSVTVDLGASGSQIVNSSFSFSIEIDRPGGADLIENVLGGGQINHLTGNTLNNLLVGGPFDDLLVGQDGDDVLEGLGGDDDLQGGQDSDTYVFDADTLLGADTVTDSASDPDGIDALDFSTTTTLGVTVDLASTAQQPVAIALVGGLPVNHLLLTLLMNPGDDVIEKVIGGSGNDVLRGNARSNFLQGGPGDDELTGRQGDDALVGGTGNDVNVFDTDIPIGTDTITEVKGAAGGIDTLDFSGSSQPVTVDLGKAVFQDVTRVTSNNQTVVHLTLQLSSGEAIENVIGGAGKDRLTGNKLDNELTGGPDDDAWNGGGGTGRVVETRDGDFTLTNGMLVIVINNVTETDTLTSIETATLTGGISPNTLNAQGFSGSVTLNGEGGVDMLKGGPADDFLSGGTGVDDIDGGGGTNRIVESRDDNFTLERLLSGDAKLTIGSEVETLKNVQAATLRVSGLVGRTLDALLFDGPVTLIGGDANDVLKGGSANDVLIGGLGDDTLMGGGGMDRLIETRDVESITLADTRVEFKNGNSIETDTLNFIEEAELTGGNAANHFNVSGWSGHGTLRGGDGTDTVIASANTNFTLSDQTLDLGAGRAYALTSIERAELTGGDSANTFTLSGWTGEAVLNGGPNLSGQDNADALVVTGDVDFVLADTSLGLSNFAALPLISIDLAYRTGGASPNLFDISGWTHEAWLIGAGDTDTLVASNNTDFTLTNASLSRSHLPDIHLDLVSIENAQLTGGTSNNVMDASAFTLGGVTLSAGDGYDILKGSTRDDVLAGGKQDDLYVFATGWGTDTVIELAGEGTDIWDFSLVTDSPIFTVANNGDVTVRAVLNVTTHSGGAIEILVGGAGSDTFTVTPSATTAFFVNGGDGNDILNLTATGGQPVTNANFEQINSP